MEIREILRKMVTAGRTAYMCHTSMQDIGYDNTPYFDIYGEIADAIYVLIGENAQTFCESVTYLTLTNLELSIDQCVGILYLYYNTRWNQKENSMENYDNGKITQHCDECPRWHDDECGGRCDAEFITECPYFMEKIFKVTKGTPACQNVKAHGKRTLK